MFELILMTAMAAQPKMEVAQFQPCVWPNKCAKQVEQVAQFQPCVWPNKCSTKAEPKQSLAQFQPCVWPNKCSKQSEPIKVVLTEPKVTTCGMPNACA